MSYIILSKIGRKGGNNSEFVFKMLTIIHFAFEEY